VRSTDAITLQLTAHGVDAYCRELARRSPTPEKRVAALDALVTFISTQTEPGEQARAEFLSIRKTLLDHFEQARAALLDERARRLQQALQARQLPDITSLYISLSREAFWSLLGCMEQQLDPAALDSVRHWVAGWLIQARQRAEQASSCPDAIDFKAAGIDVTEYLTMTDLGRYLGVESGEKGG
jgi:hypothetical protein